MKKLTTADKIMNAIVYGNPEGPSIIPMCRKHHSELLNQQTRKETVEEARERILKEEEGFTCKLCEDTGAIEDEDGFVRKCKVCADTGEGHYSQDKE